MAPAELLAEVQGAGRLALDALAYGAGAFTIAFSLASAAAAFWFFRLRRVYPPSEGFLPPVTILKPLKGVDRELYENLASFCSLEYPRLQILFTLASPDDPALGVLSRLRKDFPSLDMEVVVSRNRIGFNPKINNVANAAPFIKHGLILLSDSDIRVRPDFLRRMVAPLRDPKAGVVTCFYQSASPRGVWARLEALSVNAQFLPQAVTAAAFGMRFAMGAAILVRREAFEAAGGFRNLSGHLADDFVLGKSVQAAGWGLEYADTVVDSVPDVESAWEHLRHQARWARTIRLCNTAGYLGTALLHGFSLVTLRIAVCGAKAPLMALALAILAAKAASKLLIAAVLPARRQSHASLLLLPLSEWIAFAAWLSGFGSGRVLWRGEAYSLPRGEPCDPLAAPAPNAPPHGREDRSHPLAAALKVAHENT